MVISTIRPVVPTLDTDIAKPIGRVMNPVYQTKQYERWRAAVIKRADSRCEWPGCGRKERRMFADHIVELKDGGPRYDIANGQCLCGAHHTIKTNRERARRHSA